jgi:hypothetical protein
MNPWNPVSLSVALCSMLSFASFSGTSAAEAVVARAGGCAPLHDPAYTAAARIDAVAKRIENACVKRLIAVSSGSRVGRRSR